MVAFGFLPHYFWRWWGQVVGMQKLLGRSTCSWELVLMPSLTPKPPGETFNNYFCHLVVLNITHSWISFKRVCFDWKDYILRYPCSTCTSIQEKDNEIGEFCSRSVIFSTFSIKTHVYTFSETIPWNDEITKSGYSCNALC